MSHQTNLTSSEIAALWSQYLSETAALCFNKFLLIHLKDQEIKNQYEQAILLSSQHVDKIKEFLSAENFPIPIGFTENDVVHNTPPLFTDKLCLHYLNIMSIHGCHGYSGAVTTCSRQDVRTYFTECLTTAVDLCNSTKDLLLEKGIYSRSPTIFPPERAEFVQHERFLAGWFGEVRALSCIEITDIYFNLKKSMLAKAVTVAFSQVVQSKKIHNFLLDAVNTKDSHINMFYQVLSKEELSSPPTLEPEVMDTTTSPFSEKLIMFQVGFLFSTAMVYYGTGLASSPRRDLTPKYLSAIGDDAKISGKWTELMIENGWLEQPPLAEDRKKLAKK